MEVTIEKLVHGGQGLGTLEDGKKALVWNALPGETVRFTPKKSKSSFVEGVAEEIINPSADRLEPRDELYLSTSPWQMMRYETENDAKKAILTESLERAGVTLTTDINFKYPDEQWHYRNKMEYSFFGDDDGLHLALFNRGTHGKQPVTGSSIARPEIDAVANTIRDILATKNVRAGDLKTVIVRCNQAGECVAALFVKTEDFPIFKELEAVCQGVAVYYSTPKSPASVLTKELRVFGDLTLTDTLGDTPIQYDVRSFFQGNVPAYSMALDDISANLKPGPVTDMYAGVGSIGLSVASGYLKLVELDEASVAMARLNAGENVSIIHAAAEKSLEHIPGGAGQTVIFDPPRAGLHKYVVPRVVQQAPEHIIYLSCNPSTLARDLELLQSSYDIVSLNGYNFFPRTPHIEALAVLHKK